MASIFGGTQHQGQSSSSSTSYRPEDLKSIQDQQDRATQAVQGFGTYAKDLAGRGLGAAESINANFNASPQTLDAFGQGQLSQQLQMNQLGQNKVQNQIGQQFRNSPMLAKILQSQQAGQSLLANNPLAFQALESQLGRTQQAQQMGNQANLQKIGALGQTQGIAGAGVAAEGNLLSQLTSLGQAFGTQNTQQGGKATTSGLLGGLFGK